MKRLATILLLLCVLNAQADYFRPVQDNWTGVMHGDSLLHDGDLNTSSTADQTGCKMPDNVMSWVYGMYTDKTNVMFFNIGKSGSTIYDQYTGIAELSYALFAYNLFHGYNTNAIVNVGYSQASDNAGLNSNQMFLAYSNNFRALLVTTNSFAYTNEGGSSVSNHVDWVPFSILPAFSSDGGIPSATSSFARMTAVVTAGTAYGAGFINTCSNTVSVVTNWINAGDNPPLDITTGLKAGHYTCLGELLWAFAFWMQTTTDTNVSNVTVDYAAGTITSTNHCTASVSSKGNGSITFVQHPLRMTPGWDIKDSVDLLGNVTTNDCSAFPQIWPAAGNFWQETITVTGLPTGLYNVFENGKLKGIVSSATLSSGWNIATNYVGDRWTQRVEQLGRCRDVENANRVTLLVSSGTGFPLLGSLAFTKYPASTGDALGAQLDSAISGIKTNATHSFAAITTESQGQDFTYQIVPNAVIATTTATGGTVHF